MRCLERDLLHILCGFQPAHRLPNCWLHHISPNIFPICPWHACVMAFPVLNPPREQGPITTIHPLLPFNDHFRNFFFPCLRARLRSGHIFTRFERCAVSVNRPVNHVLISFLVLFPNHPPPTVSFFILRPCVWLPCVSPTVVKLLSPTPHFFLSRPPFTLFLLSFAPFRALVAACPVLSDHYGTDL